MSTDRTLLIRTFMQSVRRLRFKQLVFLAVLSTTAILACKDDPMGPDGTGRIVLRIAPLEEAQPATGSQAAPRESANSGRTEPVTAKAGDSLAVVDSGSASDEAPAQVAQPQVPRRDILRSIIQGPTPFSQDYTPNADGSLDVTIPDLAVGTYTVQVWGMDTDLGGQLVSESDSALSPAEPHSRTPASRRSWHERLSVSCQTYTASERTSPREYYGRAPSRCGPGPSNPWFYGAPSPSLRSCVPARMLA